MALEPAEPNLDEIRGRTLRVFYSGEPMADPVLEFLTDGSGAVYFLHESLHGAGAPEAMRLQIRRELPLEPFAAAARSLMHHSSNSR